MITDNLFELLFKMEPLPTELRDEENRNALARYADSRAGFSYHPHRQLLLMAGQVSDYIFFVESGLVRGYYYDEHKLKEHTVCLWNEHCIVSEPNSLFKRKASTLYMEVMPDSKLLSFSIQHIQEVFDMFPYTEAFARCLTLQYASLHAKRNHELISLSAWERYQQMLITYPKIEQMITKEIIASYLDIAPQSLSRLLKENRGF
ncbi:MAG: hypothetical protein JWQ66_2375 [Mucilaginibacter sp.]|nr:hypothetical protein [Mucilaginibacter sp.]